MEEIEEGFTGEMEDQIIRDIIYSSPNYVDDSPPRPRGCGCGYYCYECLGMSWSDF